MSVKRYRYDFQSGLVADDKGGLVSYADYEKLAAENAGMKQDTPDLQTMMSALDAFFDDEEVPERAMLAAYNILRGAVETPATDAFLAEVRAQGVEMAVDVVKQCYDNICAGGLQENREYEESIVQPHLDGIDDELKEIIDQLRKGVQS
ncbi:TPA: hypothetical protein ACG0L8_004294 [Enterobacter bugandensis]